MTKEVFWITAIISVPYVLAYILQWAYNADVKRQTQDDDDLARQYFGKDGWPK